MNWTSLCKEFNVPRRELVSYTVTKRKGWETHSFTYEVPPKRPTKTQLLEGGLSESEVDDFRLYLGRRNLWKNWRAWLTSWVKYGWGRKRDAYESQIS